MILMGEHFLMMVENKIDKIKIGRKTLFISGDKSPKTVSNKFGGVSSLLRHKRYPN